jgi:DNA-binding transcriptional ArsR family regulator
MVNPSVNYDRLTQAFGALADPTRCAVIDALAREGIMAVSELASEHEMSLPGFLKHVRVLERAGLLTTEKVGRTRHCRLVTPRLAEAERWIREHRTFWESQLASLDRFLQDSTPGEVED